MLEASLCRKNTKEEWLPLRFYFPPTPIKTMDLIGYFFGPEFALLENYPSCGSYGRFTSLCKTNIQVGWRRLRFLIPELGYS